MRLWKAAIELAGEDDARVLLKRATECCPQVCAGLRVPKHMLLRVAQHMQCCKDYINKCSALMQTSDSILSHTMLPLGLCTFQVPILSSFLVLFRFMHFRASPRLMHHPGAFDEHPLHQGVLSSKCCMHHAARGLMS